MRQNPGLGFMRSCRFGYPGRSDGNVRLGIRRTWGGALLQRVLSAKLGSLQFHLHSGHKQQFLSRKAVGVFSYKELSWLV